MSAFLSNKYLKFWHLLRRDTPAIATDVLCPACGYNLRGLRPGGTCPECGRPIPLDLTASVDPLLSGARAQRVMILWGLTLIAVCSAATVAARLGFGIAWAVHIPAPLWSYIACDTAIAAAWTCGVFLATPRRLDAMLPRHAWLRMLARWSQIAWLPADICWLLAETRYAFTPPQDVLLLWATMLPLAGWIGVLALAFLLLRIAEDVDLDDAPRRIGMAIWAVPVLTLVMLFIPLQAYFFVLALVAPLLLVWGWYVIGFARGVWEMRQHVAWGIRMGGEAHDREARIAATKAQLEREALMQVRPLPPPPHAPPTSPWPRRKSRS